MASNRIHVDPPAETSNGYDIIIEPGLLAALGERAAEFGLNGRVIVATNTTLAPMYGNALASALADAAVVTMPDGEQYKSGETVSQLYGQFVEAGLDRSGTVIALGGGVVGDTVGYAAATYMRGVRLLQIPTSLLAMVDSSVGGKVGVDVPQGKNLVGAFKQPEAVIIDPNVLRTLPEREWRCGMAEVIKHGLIADKTLLDVVVDGPDYPTYEMMAATLVRQAVQVKVDVVRADPYENGIRAHLNLGHTFAHAIERVSNYSWLHGEAVGVGLVAAARLSWALKLCDAGLPEYVKELVRDVGLPTRIKDEFDPEALYSAMGTDKKWRAGRSRFVLLRAVGEPLIVDDVPKQTVIDVLKTLL